MRVVAIDRAVDRASSPSEALLRASRWRRSIGLEVVPPHDESSGDEETSGLIHETPSRPAIADAIALHHGRDIEHLRRPAAHGAYPTRRAPMWMWFQWLPPT